MAYDQVMNLQEWQQRVDAARHTDELLKRGGWHGFLNTDKTAGAPVHGGFALVRWTLPSVCVAHDDPEEAMRLATMVEQAISDDGAARFEAGRKLALG
jgi:hypothetical protein